MARSRKSVKRPKKAIVKQNKKKISKGMREPVVGRLWKDKKTVRSNYASMGLAAQVNDDSSVAVTVNSRSGTLDPTYTSSLSLGTGQLQIVGERKLTAVTCEEATDVKEQVQQELDEIANCEPIPRVFMFEGDQEFVERLLAKHGPNNFAAMARDHRLNPYQLTPAQIRKKLERHRRFTEEVAQRSSGAADTHKPPRGQATRLPCSSWNVYPRIGV